MDWSWFTWGISMQWVMVRHIFTEIWVDIREWDILVCYLPKENEGTVVMFVCRKEYMRILNWILKPIVLLFSKDTKTVLIESLPLCHRSIRNKFKKNNNFISFIVCIKLDEIWPAIVVIRISDLEFFFYVLTLFIFQLCYYLV